MSWLSSLFGKSKNNAAQQAADAASWQRKLEGDRQHYIREGQKNIDQAFSLFDPAYYDKYRQSYVDVYNPQIDSQYQRALDKLTATLAGRGTLESSVGAQALADLSQKRSDSEADIANQAVDASNQLKSKVESARSSLYTLNTGAADPQLASARAAGEAATLTAPQARSPLGQVFSDVLSSFGTYNRADARSLNPQLPWNTFSGSAPLSGRGSSLFG